MRKMTMLAITMLAMAMLSAWTSQASACRGAKRPSGKQSAEHARRAITCLINRRRALRGLHRLHGSVPLAVAAQGHSDAMAAQNFFSHNGADGTPASRVAAAGYNVGARRWGLGEDLEWASGKLASPRAIVAGWTRSPEHRDVMFSRRFRELGIGVALGSPVSPEVQDAATITADFAFRKG